MDDIQIDCDKARAMMGAGAVTIVDIRDHDSFQRGHISGAVEINDGNINEFIEFTDKNKPVICYCYHGISSQSAAKFFIQNGFKKVYSLNGGYEQWDHFMNSKKGG